MDEFRFEHTYALTEREYVALFGIAGAKVRTLLFLLVGVACLFWAPALLLGVFIIAASAVMLGMPALIPGTATRTYHETPYLREAITYGVDQDRMWLVGSDISAEAGWRHLTVWQERGGWFFLGSTGLPRILLPISGLQEAGILERLRARAKESAVEFGKVAVGRSAV